MRRAVLAAASTSALVVLLLTLKPHQPATPVGGASPPAGTSPAPTGPASPPGGSRPGTGTYTGDAVSTQYGTVQVAATVKAGKLTDVKVIQVPSGNGRDQQIAAYAVPRLTKEALATHSAHIDAVSGASYTSQGYIQSLQSALDRAGA
ncbi:FMN-binding protein [Streptomyces sp. NBC_00838]|uniref:FMN-binding protein n=1 Tax=Streptomyces sp. NBC_00838 TaxID=2903680 RepID=UPI00386ADCAA|nr:FMN-binding protein [Streptomyces sp. NBC_00838]